MSSSRNRFRSPLSPPTSITTVNDGSPKNRLDRLAQLLLRYRVALLIVGLLLTLLAIRPASQLELDESIESFYAEDDPYLAAWRESKDWFGGDEFVLVAYADPDILETENLERLREFARELSAVPGIRPESTQSLADTLRPENASLPVRLFLRFPITRDRLLEFSRHVLIGSDDETTAIVLRLMPEDQAPVPRSETFARIRELATAHDPPAYVAGEPVQVHDMFRYVEQDATTLGVASSGLLLLVILLLFRSIRWVILPLLIVQVTLVWTRAALVLTGLKLSMVSSMLNSLVTIIGIATVTHVTVTYRDFRRTMDRQEAFRRTFTQLAPAVFWTCVTTSIGFAALLSSQITPVRSFGIMMGMGTLLVLASTLLLLPGGILIGRFDTDPRDTPAEGRLLSLLSGITRWTARRPLLVTGLAVGLMIAAFAGFFRLRVETDFSKNFRESSLLVQSLDYFESRLGGVGNWEVHFSAPDELDDESLDRLRALATDLRELELEDGTRLTKVITLADGLDFIPGIAARTVPRKLSLLKEFQPEFVPGLYNEDAGRMRVVLRALEQQPAEVKLTLIDAAEKKAREHFPDARATGLYVLLAYLISSLLSDQIVSFALAAAGIAIAMSIAFRNVWIGLISLVPNVFPILLVIGGMGWTGVPINIGTAMIASVSMGLTVDSSIHYLSGYRRARLAGADHFEAVRQTHGSVGRALVFANVALVLGFTVLALSNFIPLVYFGVLVSVAMFGGLMGNLVLLPVLLRWVNWIPESSPAADSSALATADATG